MSSWGATVRRSFVKLSSCYGCSLGFTWNFPSFCAATVYSTQFSIDKRDLLLSYFVNHYDYTCLQLDKYQTPAMMLRSKKKEVFGVPFQPGQESASRFCLFAKVQSASPPPENKPVYLNVYDLTAANGYVVWAGLGIFHSGIEVHGVEYAFGAHNYSISGVFEVEPRQCPGFRFRKSIYMGTTCVDPLQIRAFMEIHSVNYNGDTYHLISKNCNHFCEDICNKLTGNSIPRWVNRLARMGSLCNCVLPESLKISAARHDPDCQAEDSDETKLTGALSCFSSISQIQQDLHSPAKGTSCDTTGSSSGRLKKS